MEHYVESLVTVFLTNTHGVANAADTIYKRLLSMLSPDQALLAILAFRKVNISSKLQFTLPKIKFMELVDIAKTKISSPQGVDVINIIVSYTAPLDRMRAETKLMEKVNAITKSIGFS
jgi:hypothetical protein